MPIKFRCRHCQQLLGISRSRASAVVDCPQCGRAIRVPELDGRIRKVPDPRLSMKDDSALLSALTELSVLGDEQTSPPSKSDAAQSPTAAQAARPIALDPLPESSPIDIGMATNAAAIEPEPFAEEPVALSQSLAQLVDLDQSSDQNQISGELLKDMRAVSQSDGISPAMMAGVVLLVLAGIGGGWIAGQSFQTPIASGSTAKQPGERVENGAITDIADAAATGERSISGTVTFQDATGASAVDAGATVLLLPSARAGTLKLSARSLQRPADNPDRIATVAALTAFGGAVAEADVTGHFQLSSQSKGNLTVVAVSRHQERPADVPVPEPVHQLLMAWFDSTSHICGRLMVQAKPITESTDEPSVVDFQFRSQL